MSAGQGERAGAELGGEQPGEVTGRVAEALGQAGHALLLDHAGGDQAHGPCRRISAKIPVR